MGVLGHFGTQRLDIAKKYLQTLFNFLGPKCLNTLRPKYTDTHRPNCVDYFCE